MDKLSNMSAQISQSSLYNDDEVMSSAGNQVAPNEALIKF